MQLFATVCAVLVASACAVPHGALVNTGHSDQYRSDDGHGNYEFGYNEDHASGGTFRKEKGGPGYQVGSYGLRDADGRLRIVHYVADAHGFRATITSNEPGVDTHQSPAATDFTGTHASMALSHPAIVPVVADHNSYAHSYMSEPHFESSRVHNAQSYAPVDHNAQSYAPVDHNAQSYAPVDHNAQPYAPVVHNYNHHQYSPALSAPLLAQAYQPSPIFKSAYVPTYSASDASQYSPVLPTGHYGTGPTVYGNPYKGYY